MENAETRYYASTRLGTWLVVLSCAILGCPFASWATARAACSNVQFRTGPSALLPDCRAYEQVTPANKGGAQDITFSVGTDAGAVADNGQRVVLQSSTRIGPNPQSNGSVTVFSRTNAGWLPISVTPESAGQAKVVNPLFTVNLSATAFDFYTQIGGERSPTQSFESGEVGGAYAQIKETPIVPQYQETEKFDALLGTSADLTHVVLASTDHELIGTPTGTDASAYDLYEMAASDVRLVNRTTGGTLVSQCGATLGFGQGVENKSAHNAVSADGSKIFFTSPDPHPVESSEPGCSAPAQLYMRANGIETLQVSTPEAGVTPPEIDPAVYAGASATGTEVIFTTKTQLTKDDAGHTDSELYLYNTDTHTLTRVSRGESGTAEGDVEEGLGGPEYGAVISEDGSTVYFLARGKLTSDAPATGEKLYLYDIASGTVRYIASVAPDEHGHVPLFSTPDGHYLAFIAKEVSGGSFKAEGHDEVYRYDAATQALNCASCPGGPATGNASLPRVEGSSSLLSTADITPGLGTISADGHYMFFNSTDHLSLQDVSSASGGSAVGEVYEWEEEGVGGCTNVAGCQHLISSGQEGGIGSVLLGASSDGSNVFFVSHAQLVAQDSDNLADIYDARIDGGFPTPPEVSECSEECQGETGGTSGFAMPASVLLSGIGNVAPPQLGTSSAKRHRVSHLSKLVRALKKCNRRPRRQRAVCRRRARLRFGRTKVESHPRAGDFIGMPAWRFDARVTGWGQR